MSGNTVNAAVWGGADVLIAPLTATVPTTNAAFDMNSAARTEISVVTANTTTGITFPSGALTNADEGATISGTGIPALATIVSVTSATAATISAAATASGTITASIGATTNGWSFVGLLDGGQGFEEGIEVNSTDHKAWGYGVIATTYEGQKTTRTFTALEENSTVMGLVYDTAGMTFDDVAGTYSGDLGVKDYTGRILVAFVTTSGDVEKRAITKNYATVAATSAGSESETALASKGFTTTIYPDNNLKLWTVYKGASL